MPDEMRGLFLAVIKAEKKNTKKNANHHTNNKQLFSVMPFIRPIRLYFQQRRLLKLSSRGKKREAGFASYT